MPFCLWCLFCKKKTDQDSDFEPMNEDLTDFNENVCN